MATSDSTKIGSNANTATLKFSESRAPAVVPESSSRRIGRWHGHDNIANNAVTPVTARRIGVAVFDGSAMIPFIRSNNEVTLLPYPSTESSAMLKPGFSAAGVTVGQLAKAAGVNVETIRYYQRIALLPLPKRGHGSIRRYSAEDIRRVRFVKRAQALGFALDEVALLLGLSDGKHCAETRMLAEKKLNVVADKISDLTAIQKALNGLVTQCSAGSRSRGCPIIDALAADSD